MIGKRITSRSLSFVLLLCLLLSLLPGTAVALEEQEIDVSAVEQTLRAYLSENLILDLSPFYDARPRTVTYAACAASYSAFAGLPALISEQLLACMNDAWERVEPMLHPDTGWEAHVEFTYDWRMWACLYKQFRYQLDETVAAHVSVDVIQNEKLDVILSLPEPDAVFADLGDSAVFQSWMDYSNLYTLYDDKASLLEYRMPPLTLDYVRSLVFPLDDVYIRSLKDTWYQGRSGGTRRHMGTDLKANRKAAIYSCSDGDVVSVGYNKVGGYYVAVRDDLGYLYLYFHMFKNTQMVDAGARVTAGQPIGMVGNTGNSEANHLHLGIIAPDGTYVNAYTVLSHVLALKNMSPTETPPYREAIELYP